MRIVLGNLKGCFLRTMNKRMKVKVMKDLTTTSTITTVGNGYLDLMMRSLKGSGGFLHSWKATDIRWN